MSLFGENFGSIKKVDQEHMSLQALSQTSFLYNKHSLLILLIYNLFTLQLSIVRWWQQPLNGIVWAFEDEASINLVFAALLL
jgi:hypothetical protein